MSSTRLNLEPAEWRARFGRVPSLDGMRAVSISIVLIGHILLPASLVGVSALGLKIFFFLSGFLITRLLLAEAHTYGNISFQSFYIRRVIRIYPVILVYTAIVSIVALSRGYDIRIQDLAGVFFYFVNYLVIHYTHVGGQLSLPVGMMWSLSIEEQFYVVAPVAFSLLRCRGSKFAFAALFVCIASIAIRLIYVALQPDIVNTLELYWRSETRFDCIAYGVILSCMTESDFGRRLIAVLSTRAALVLGILVLAGSFVIRDNYFQNTWRFSVQGMALVPIFASFVFAKPIPIINAILNTRLFVWVGSLSYSLYIWHGGVEFLFGDFLHNLPKPLFSTFHLLAAFGLALLSYYFVEKPARRLRHLLAARGIFSKSSGETAETNAVSATEVHRVPG